MSIKYWQVNIDRTICFFEAATKRERRRQAAGAGNDNEAEEEEEAVADKRTSNVAAGQSELWDN